MIIIECSYIIMVIIPVVGAVAAGVAVVIALTVIGLAYIVYRKNLHGGQGGGDNPHGGDDNPPGGGDNPPGGGDNAQGFVVGKCNVSHILLCYSSVLYINN